MIIHQCEILIISRFYQRLKYIPDIVQFLQPLQVYTTYVYMYVYALYVIPQITIL